MVSPEVQTLDKLKAELTAVTNNLERADEIENPIERFFKRENLLDLQDELQLEIEQATSSPDHS